MRKSNIRSKSRQAVSLVDLARQWKADRQKRGEPIILQAHRSKRWSRKLAGKTEFFGAITDAPDFGYSDAIKKYADMVNGVKPASDAGATLRDVCNRYLSIKLDQRDRGELSENHYGNIHRTGAMLIEHFGKHRLLSTFGPADFEPLHKLIAEKHGVTARGREVALVKSIFHFAYNCEMIDRPIRFGPIFKAPDKATLRKARAQRKREHGPKMFAPTELRTMIEGADVHLKAMLLLAANCGFGGTDCSRLYRGAVNLDAGWIDYPRDKTGVERRCPLWPETAVAVRASLAKRPQAKDPADDDLVFLTRLGQPWVRHERSGKETDKDFKVVRKDSIAQAVTRLTKRLGVHRPRFGIYAIRHGFQTIAEGAADTAAVRMIMGHADQNMSDAYREGIENERLLKVVEHVHVWLFGG